MNEWISVKDRLPENDDDVLLLIQYYKHEKDDEGNWIDRNYKMIIQGCVFDLNYGDEDFIENDYEYKYRNPHIGFNIEDSRFNEFEINITSQILDIPKEWVTHWMPLPELPK